MALIQCPECGKEISDRSERCIHCGYPLGKDDAGRPQAPETGRKHAPVGDRKRLVLIGAAAGAILLVALLVILLTRGNGLEMPYGIRSGMSLGEMTRLMEDNGFRASHINTTAIYTTQFFDSAYVEGQRTSFSCVDTWTADSRIELSVGHFFEEDARYGGNNHSPEFDRLVKKLTDRYGKPREKDINGYFWKNGKVELSLEYAKTDGGGEYWLNYYLYR